MNSDQTKDKIYYSIPNDCILVLERGRILRSEDYIVYNFDWGLDRFLQENQIVYIGEV